MESRPTSTVEDPAVRVAQIDQDFNSARHTEDWYGIIARVPWLIGHVKALTTELREVARERDTAYADRARLVALDTAIYPTTSNTDPAWPDWRVVYLNTPAGQLSWHIHPQDLHLFDHVPYDPDTVWDGHTTPEKNERIADLTRILIETPALAPSDVADADVKISGLIDKVHQYQLLHWVVPEAADGILDLVNEVAAALGLAIRG